MKAGHPLGLQRQWLRGDAPRQHEPLLSPDVCAAIYAPEESQIKASHVVKAFSAAAARSGAKLHNHSEITGIRQHHARATGVYTAKGEMIGCNHLVVAAGAWAAHFSAWLNIELPVSPQRAQVLTLRHPSPPL